MKFNITLVHRRFILCLLFSNTKRSWR